MQCLYVVKNYFVWYCEAVEMIPRHDHEALEFLAVGSAVLLTAIAAVVYAVIQAVRRKRT